VLHLLENEQLSRSGAPLPKADQLALFAATRHPALDRLAQIDVNSLTPMQALALLEELGREAKSD
jgi:hypothetical protein